jgi:peptide/nickel transport system substrate-binding protein
MRKKLYLLMGLVGLASLVLAACAAPAPGVTQQETQQETESEEVTGPAAAAEESAEELRRIVVAQGEGVESWDPPAGWDTASEWIEMNVYDCLVYPDRETGEVVGWLAESWENLDETTWRLKLREDVEFHNGYPFTAEDAKYSIDRIINGSKEEFIVFDQWAFVKEVRILDDYTIEIETNEPDPAFLSELSGTGCGVVSKPYVEEVGNDGLANFGVGTGPFKLKDYDRESFVIMEANENYWGGKPEIDELVFRVIPEVSTRVAELLAGGVDIAPGVLPQDWERIESDPRLQMVHYLTDRVYELTTAVTAPPGVDGVATSVQEIRAAIDYAIDREELIDLAGGFGEPTRTRLTPPIPCWDTVDPPLYGVNPFNPERAKELMEEAGYPDVPGGPVITVHGTFGQYIAQKEIAETIAAMLEEVGFEVELDIREFSTFRETVYQGSNEELMLQSLGNFITDPWLFILNYDSKFGERIHTRTRHSNPEIDALAEKVNVEMDPEQRCEYVAEFAQIVAEYRSSIPLFQMADAMATPANVQWTPPPDGMLQFMNLHFTD